MRFCRAERGAGRPKYLACFAVNDAVRLEWQGVWYPTRVEDIGAGGLWIACPSDDEGDIAVVEGGALHVAASQQQGLRCFQAVLLERRPGSPALLRLGLRADVGRLQRRDYARAPLMLPVRFRMLGEGENAPFCEAITRDIGGGGLMMLVERPCIPAAGERLAVEIILPDGPARARVLVTRVEPAPDHPHVARVCAQFTEIGVRDQDHILGRVLARQAELHRAGLM